MKKTCTWLVAMGCLLAVAGTTHAGGPTMALLLLPQLFGQEPDRDLPSSADQSRRLPRQAGFNGTTQPNPPSILPYPTVEIEGDDIDLLDEGVSMLICRTLSQWVSQIIRPSPPYNLAIDAIAGYFAVIDAKDAAASVAAANNNRAVGSGLAIGAGSGALVGSAFPTGNGQVGSFQIGAGFNSDNGVTGNLALCPKSTAADACTGSGCCEAVKKIVAAKACKCCEDCKDCCCKQATGRCLPIQAGSPFRVFRETSGGIVAEIYAIEQVPMPSTPQAACPMMQMAMPRCAPEMLHYPQVVPFGTCGPVPPQALHDVPLYPVEALKELIQQRQAITHAIEQIERELMQLAIAKQQQQASVMQAGHNAQKVHLVTEDFEAHCDSLRCAGENVMVLEGNVVLTSRKGPARRIEAARVLVNLKDGTLKVESATTIGTSQAQPMIMERVQMVSDVPQLTLPSPWYLKNPPTYFPPAAPLMPQSWQPAPSRLTPPIVPVAPRPDPGTSVPYFKF